MRLSLVVFSIALAGSPHAGFAQRLQHAAYAPPSLRQAQRVGNPGVHTLASLPGVSSRSEAAWRGAQIGMVLGGVALGSYAYFSSGECHPDDPCFTHIVTALGVGIGVVAGGITGAVIGAARWRPMRSASRANRLTSAAADERARSNPRLRP